MSRWFRPLSFERGVEIGQVFQLGLKYSEALDLKVLNQNGKTVPVWMGCYGMRGALCLPASPRRTMTTRVWRGR